MAEARAGNLASILAQYLHGTFAAGDASLRQLAFRSQRIGGPDAPDVEWLPSLVSGRAGLTGAGSISVTDAQGIVRHSTQPAMIGQSRRDQYLFRRLSSEPTDAFVVNPPYLSVSEPKQFIIPVGRRLTTATAPLTASSRSPSRRRCCGVFSGRSTSELRAPSRCCTRTGSS